MHKKLPQKMLPKRKAPAMVSDQVAGKRVAALRPPKKAKKRLGGMAATAPPMAPMGTGGY